MDAAYAINKALSVRNLEREDLNDLLERSLADDSDWPKNNYYKACCRNKVLDDIDELGIKEFVTEDTRNVFIVDRKYYFYGISLKWGVKGRKRKHYPSNGFKEFYEKYAKEYVEGR
jgi:hypothetical protein